jgi:hypothetical protein
MKPTSALLRRFLTAALVILPPLAGTDLCTIGALTGRTDLMCGMERALARPAAAAPAACPHCASAGPAPATGPAPASNGGPTCCDLRPQAATAGEAPALSAPAPLAHPAVTAPDFAFVIPPAPAVPCVVADAGRAPPGDPPPPPSPRAPPLG